MIFQLRLFLICDHSIFRVKNHRMCLAKNNFTTLQVFSREYIAKLVWSLVSGHRSQVVDMSYNLNIYYVTDHKFNQLDPSVETFSP